MSVHLRLPLGLAGDGSFLTVEEDSYDEIVQCVAVVLRTRPEERLATPELGVEDATFRRFDAPSALAEVSVEEPRATVAVVENAFTDDGVQTVRLSVTKGA